MGEVVRLLQGCKCVGIDTNCFIFQFESDHYPQHAPLAQELFELVQSGIVKGVTSTITITEVMTLPRRLGLEDIAYQYKMLLMNFPNLQIRDITPEVADRAAMLRGVYNLRTPDALQTAAALVAGADAFVTFDRDLRRLRSVFRTIIVETD
ncbi:MAG: type II toxin-antitoxin system VapC family toxin [Bacillota bacterium]